MRTVSVLVLCTALLLLSTTQQAAGLSYELCNSYGAEFVTDSPHLTGLYPFYSLIFMCTGVPLCCSTLTTPTMEHTSGNMLPLQLGNQLVFNHGGMSD